jgi:tetratricopeptide (TPR) repeat protein
VRPRSHAIERLAQLVKAALACWQRTERALEAVNELGPFNTPDLERRRQELRVFAGRMRPPAEQQALLDELATWTEASNDPITHGAYAGWLGRLRYRQGRYEEAAELNARAAAHEPWVTAKLAALLRSASCRMEAFQLDEAAAVAREAMESAERYRLPFHEARAERVLRSVAYRTGAARAADLELVEAATHLRVGDWEAMLSLNEAAVAFRAGEDDVAVQLAQRAENAWTAMGEVSGGALLAGSLALACGAEASDDDVGRLVERALACPMADVGLQALGLVARAGRAPALDEDRLTAMTARLPEGMWDERLEVLSIREALDALSELRRRGKPP